MDVFAERFLSLEERFGRLFVENDHFTALDHVDLVEKAPARDGHVVDMEHVGRTRGDLPRPVLLAVSHALGTAAQVAGYVFDLGEVCAHELDGTFVETDRAVGTIALVGHRSPAGPEIDRVDGLSFEVAPHAVQQTLARSQQHDKHEDAPRHGKSREEGAHLVALHRFEYFTQNVEHGFRTR